MKKKVLLISLMIAVFLIAFSVSAFAADIVAAKTEDETYGTVIKLNADPGLDEAYKYVSTLKKINDAGTDKDALCIVTDGAEIPSYYVFPSSYILLEQTDGLFMLYGGDDTTPGLKQAMIEFNDALNTEYYEGYATTGSGGDKRLTNIVRFVFPTDVTYMSNGKCCLRSITNLVEIRIKHAIDFSSAAEPFKSSSNLKTVLGFENVNPSQIPSKMFYGCSSLESIKLPTGITKITDSMFRGCKKITFANLSECTQLTTIGNCAFMDTGAITFTLPDSVTSIGTEAFRSAFKDGGSFTIGRNSKLETIGNDAFNDCRKLASIYIPSTVTSIGERAFKQCYALTTFENFENCGITTIEADTFYYTYKLTSIKIPETVETIGSKAFYQNEKLSLVYIPKSVTSIAADAFSGTHPSNAVYVYTGVDKTIFNNATRFNDEGVKVIEDGSYSPSNTYTGVNLVIGYSHCVVYNNGNHEDISVTLDFKSFYEAIGVTNACACGVTAKGEDIPTIFTCPGFSIPEDASKFGISITYHVNTKAYAKYEELSGNTVEYGVYAVLEERLGNDAIIDENGVASEVAKLRYIDNRNVARYDFIINGFTTPEYQALNIAMGTFVKVTDKEGVAKYTLLQAKTPESGNYYFVTYNAVKAGQQ